MNIDEKLPAFKNSLSKNKLNNNGLKTSIDQSAVTAGEDANVDLNLSSDGHSSADAESKNKKDKKSTSEESKSLETDLKISDQELKAINLKLLNLI
jgi:hypothetical protein